MSHNPNINYGYPARQNYYMEEPDPEEFAAEYTDSEELSENPQMLQTVPRANITEIYSRKPQVMAPQQHQIVPSEPRYHQNQKQYIQQCYYENIRQLPRTHVAVPLQDYEYDPRLHQYCPLSTASQHDTNYDSAAYRSAHHDMVNSRSYQEAVHPNVIQKQQNVKRYPITVGTPKYYRKPPANAVFKRPSALCLPVASQPDPAVYRKPRRPTVNELQYAYQQQVTQHQQQILHQQQIPHQDQIGRITHQEQISHQQHIPHQDISYTNEVPSLHRLKKRGSGFVHHKMDSGGDVSVKISDNLDDMLDTFEKENEIPKAKSKSDIAKFARFLKPRVPASVKARQERMRLKAMKEAEEKCALGDVNDKISSGPDEQDLTADSLERLLNQLKKCELGISKETVDKTKAEGGEIRTQQNENAQESDGLESSAEKPDVNDDEHKKETTTNKLISKSFNYQDITNQMKRSQSESKSYGDSAENSTPQSSIQDITRRITTSLSDSASQRPRSHAPKPSLDDNCALELHRSKSYIVNLIDRALSKELGTIPSERRKEFDNMNPRKAINMMHRHGGICDKELCLEITSALTDSIISNATAPETPPSSSKSKVCCCNGEEPTYIKQLKQLRWGHLKHIQREVRRLEDLERFLDACSLNTISEL